MKSQAFIPYTANCKSEEEMMAESLRFFEDCNARRSVRDISSKSVPKVLIERILMTAGTAPSGANKQPWHFCAVSNTDLKKQIRKAAEQEEELNYSGRMSEEWLKDLAPLGTDANKPFLEEAPWLIIVFKKSYNVEADNSKTKNYYVNESVGLACGFLLAAIHRLGLVSLTHTPSPMGFLSELLQRPSNEKPFLLIPVGYPKEGALVPNIQRKPLASISTWHE